MKTAEDIMHTDLIVLGPQQTLQDALHCFQDKRISGAPVVDESGIVLGVISQTTVNNHITRLGGTLSDRIEDAMTPYVFTTFRHTPLTEMLETVVSTGIHRVIVIDSHHRPVGIVTCLDLVEDFLEYLRAG